MAASLAGTIFDPHAGETSSSLNGGAIALQYTEYDSTGGALPESLAGGMGSAASLTKDHNWDIQVPPGMALCPSRSYFTIDLKLNDGSVDPDLLPAYGQFIRGAPHALWARATIGIAGSTIEASDDVFEAAYINHLRTESRAWRETVGQRDGGWEPSRAKRRAAHTNTVAPVLATSSQAGSQWINYQFQPASFGLFAYSGTTWLGSQKLNLHLKGRPDWRTAIMDCDRHNMTLAPDGFAAPGDYSPLNFRVSARRLRFVACYVQPHPIFIPRPVQMSRSIDFQSSLMVNKTTIGNLGAGVVSRTLDITLPGNASALWIYFQDGETRRTLACNAPYDKPDPCHAGLFEIHELSVQHDGKSYPEAGPYSQLQLVPTQAGYEDGGAYRTFSQSMNHESNPLGTPVTFGEWNGTGDLRYSTQSLLVATHGGTTPAQGVVAAAAAVGAAAAAPAIAGVFEDAAAAPAVVGVWPVPAVPARPAVQAQAAILAAAETPFSGADQIWGFKLVKIIQPSPMSRFGIRLRLLCTVPGMECVVVAATSKTLQLPFTDDGMLAGVEVVNA
jgi:hypothetical protein